MERECLGLDPSGDRGSLARWSNFIYLLCRKGNNLQVFEVPRRPVDMYPVTQATKKIVFTAETVRLGYLPSLILPLRFLVTD